MPKPRLVAVSLASCLLLASACSDDSSTKSDAGTKHDAGGAAIPRIDAAVGADDPLPPCSRFDPAACSKGQVCNELIRQDASGTAVIYASCIDAPKLRALGDPCTPWLDQYETKGLVDTVLIDPCGDGTICSDDPMVRGASSCQTVCQSSTFGDTAKLCASSSQYCFGPGQYEEVCIESDACDAAKQTGCAKGQACYLQLGDSGDRVLSVCLTPNPTPIADQAACQYVNDCKPGSSCFGPVHLETSQWAATDIVCRPTCAKGASNNGGSDAGADDAGAACTCEAYSSSSLDFSEIPKPPYGQCEL